ncbi:MAG: VPLPA-CTERM sorting domain-containing protein [Pseudomonadota bacterium]
MQNKIVLLAAAIMLCLSHQGAAATITINFTGQVDNTMFNDPDMLFGTINAGEPQGFFTGDITLPAGGNGTINFDAITDAQFVFGNTSLDESQIIGVLGTNELTFLDGVLDAYVIQFNSVFGALDVELTNTVFSISMSTPGGDAFAGGTINPVPLPAAAWLFLSALMSLVALRRRHSGKHRRHSDAGMSARSLKHQAA